MLPNGKWARKYDCCIECGTTEKEHRGHGLCLCCGSIQYYKNNSKEKIECSKKYYEENSEIIGKKQKKYREKNSEKISKRNKKYREKNSEKINKQRRDKYKENPEEFIERSIEYEKKNSEKVNKQKREYYKKRRKTDFHYKLKKNISRSINHRLKGRLSSKNGKSTFSFLPYEIEDLKQHLESLFTEGMTWQNYGKWHIDHKKPDRLFDYKSVDDKEFQKCWALENLQPLWAIDNLRKGSKY